MRCWPLVHRRKRPELLLSRSRSVEHLATKQDIAALEVKMWRMAVAVASLAVLLNRFLDWVIK